MALFANCKTPSTYQWDYEQLHPRGYPFCKAVFSALKHCGNKMPVKYFMFMETHWGGCGCFAQTAGRHTISLDGALSAAIGFR